MSKGTGELKWILSSIFWITSTAFNFIEAAQERGGGDSVALEFRDLGRSLAQSFVAEPATFEQISGLSSEKFQNAVERVRVISTEEPLQFRGAMVDARNDQQKECIEIHRSRWKMYEVNFQKKLRIVIHEYIAINGVNDDDGSISGKIVSWIVSAPMRAKRLTENYFPITDRIFDCGLLSGLEVAFKVGYLNHGDVPETLEYFRQAWIVSFIESEGKRDALRYSLNEGISNARNLELKLSLGGIQVALRAGVSDIQIGRKTSSELKDEISNNQTAMKQFWDQIVDLRQRYCMGILP